MDVLPKEVLNLYSEIKIERKVDLFKEPLIIVWAEIDDRLEAFEYSLFKQLPPAEWLKEKGIFIIMGIIKYEWANTEEELTAKVQRWQGWVPIGTSEKRNSPDNQQELYLQKVGKYIVQRLTQDERAHLKFRQGT